MIWHDRREILDNLVEKYVLPEGKEREYLSALSVIASTEKEHPSVRNLAQEMLIVTPSQTISHKLREISFVHDYENKELINKIFL